jgi:hypothetical protein
MLCQEEYVTLLDLHRQGWTKKEIAAELGPPGLTESPSPIDSHQPWDV